MEPTCRGHGFGHACTSPQSPSNPRCPQPSPLPIPAPCSPSLLFSGPWARRPRWGSVWAWTVRNRAGETGVGAEDGKGGWKSLKRRGGRGWEWGRSLTDWQGHRFLTSIDPGFLHPSKAGSAAFDQPLGRTHVFWSSIRRVRFSDTLDHVIEKKYSYIFFI